MASSPADVFAALVACGRDAVARSAAGSHSSTGTTGAPGSTSGPGASGTATAGDALAGPIRAVARTPEGAGALMTLATAHAMGPIAARAMLDHARDLLPPEVAQRLADARRDAAVRALDAVRQLRTILEALAATRIAALPYKGPGLAVDAYGDPALRSFDDLDVLVEPGAVDAAAAVLARHGYAPADGRLWAASRFAHEWCGQVMFASRAERFPVELHWRVCDRKLPWDPPLAALVARGREVDVAGRGTRVVGREDQLVLVALHAARHGWDSLEGLVAVAALCGQRVDGEHVVALAGEVGGRRATCATVMAACALLGAEVPPAVAACASADARMPALVADVRRRVEAGSAGTRRDAAAHLAALDSVGDRVRYVLSALFMPTTRDIEAVPLPRPARALYGLVRPARVVARALAGKKGPG